ncbi:DUF2087 domain-containing protein [Aquibacillus rhizosphaerae]|uniref:DUF2087 domain-containing protein n=1 Tax=Aquibacillus rhizosphaerae TaxID=3051431 RepID=A0ABT7L300_9BACI|nr:DUF2087 domain-containing protein [Aquibacillus sp. LR5S19]MDL4840223.1 DUF2087 domain-containing protein [Aquibacillus sp. LR5S19]
MGNQEPFWNATIDELSDGYIQSGDEYVCLLCSERFEDGIIYPMDGTLYEAKKAIARHIEEIHTSVLHFFLDLDKKYTGLSDHQNELLHYFSKGLSDKEIVKELNGGSPSTIRNHRFKLKEKEKQAKVFLALMNLLNKKADKKTEDNFVSFHKGAKMVDERYAITEEEKQKVLSTYFKQGTDGKLDTFPSKEKRKLIVLQSIVKRFDRNKKYGEKEINEILKPIYSDFATIRRYLIEYGFMNRSKDCTEYWVKN